ncbi:MAG TPA: hypothetical protein VK181_22245 [Rhizobium sp.]|nr:hypothetical protein [Rhizobium sp.]
MEVPAVPQKWIDGMANAVNSAIAKAGAAAPITALPTGGWQVLNLEVADSGVLRFAAISHAEIYASIQTISDSVECRLTVPDRGGDAWVFYFRFDGEKVILVRFVEATVPGPSPDAKAIERGRGGK